MRRPMLLVGVALAMVLAGLGAWQLVGRQDEGVTIRAHFTGVPGLYEGNNVSVLGVPVGKVEKIEPRGTEVVVTMTVPSDLKLPADASAVIVPASLVTDRVVELTPAYVGGPVLEGDADIPASRTRVPVEFDDLVRSVTGMAESLTKLEKKTGAIDEFLGVSATNARGNGTALRQAIHGAASAMSVFAGNRQSTEALVRSLAKLTKLLAASDSTIRSFGTTVTDATHFMSSESANLKASLDAMLDLVFDVEKFVRTHKAGLKRGMSDLDVTARTLTRRSKQLGEAVDLLPLLMQNLIRTYDAEHRSVRTHGELWEGVLTAAELRQICQAATQLPACDTAGDLLALGADLGLTELILGTIAEQSR